MKVNLKAIKKYCNLRKITYNTYEYSGTLYYIGSMIINVRKTGRARNEFLKIN